MNGVALQDVNRRLIDNEMVTADELYEKHKKFVWKIAHKYRGACSRIGIEIKDLLGIASIGFMKAYEQFDQTKGFKFITYAGSKMEGEIFRYFREQGHMVKFPRAAIDLSRKIHKHDMGNCSDEEIAEHFDVDIKAVHGAREYAREAYSMEKEIYEDDGQPITLKDQQGTEQDMTEVNVNEFLDSLPNKLKAVAKGLMKTKTQKEIGEEIGTSQMQVSRLQQQLKEKYMEWESGKMAHANLEKAKHLLKTTDKTYKEIAEETGIKEGTVGYHGKKIRSNKTSEKAVQAVQPSSETKDTQKKEKVLQDDLQAKFNRLSEQHAKLTEENNRLYKEKNDLIIELGDLKNKQAIHEYDMKQAENAIDSYKGMLRERNKDCDVLEDELSKLHEAYDRLKAWVQVDIGVIR